MLQTQNRLVDFLGMVLMENGRVSMFKLVDRLSACCRARAQRPGQAHGSSSPKAVLSPIQTSQIVDLIADICFIVTSHLLGRLNTYLVKVCTP